MALAGLFIAGFAVLAVVGVVFLVFKIVLWAVLFPVRLLMKLVWIPIGLIAGGFSLAAGAVIVPVVLVVGIVVAIVGAIAALLALLIPAVPFVLLALAIWAVMRRNPQSTVAS